MDHHHCHCPPTDHHAPPPCEQPQDSSWNPAHHCHPPCPPPPPCEQDNNNYYFWNNPAVRVEMPATGGSRAPLLESSKPRAADQSATVRTHACIYIYLDYDYLRSSQACVRVRRLINLTLARLFDFPAQEALLLVLLFFAAIAGLVYWCWFR